MDVNADEGQEAEVAEEGVDTGQGSEEVAPAVATATSVAEVEFELLFMLALAAVSSPFIFLCFASALIS